jgi:hypothetical protein
VKIDGVTGQRLGLHSTRREPDRERGPRRKRSRSSFIGAKGGWISARSIRSIL